jgi:UDP-glucuronate 4-epimerase
LIFKVKSEIEAMGNILITGGAGFIGSHLCEQLLKDGYMVICLDNFDSFYDPNIKIKNIEGMGKRFPNQFKLVTGDIRNYEHLTKTFKKNRIDSVAHFAARAGVRPSINNPLLYQDVNIRGTIVLLETCKDFGIKDFIFASSSSVYGENPRVPFSEGDLDIQPISPYGATKRAGELLCYSYHHLHAINIAPGRGQRWRSINSPGWLIRVKKFQYTEMALPGETTPISMT